MKNVRIIADVDRKYTLTPPKKPDRRVADRALSNARTRERTKAYVTAVRDMTKGREMRPYVGFGRDKWTRTTDPHLIRVVL